MTDFSGININVRDSRSKAKTDVQAARPLRLDAEAQEVLSTIALWNMVAPGSKFRIDPKRPDQWGAKAMTRINALMLSVRNARAQAAQYAGRACLVIVKDAKTMTEARKRIAAAIEGTEYDASTDVEPEDKADAQ